jgi:hypothetical protein
MRNAYKVLIKKNLKESDHLEGLRADGKIIGFIM